MKGIMSSNYRMVRFECMHLGLAHVELCILVAKRLPQKIRRRSGESII